MKFTKKDLLQLGGASLSFEESLGFEFSELKKNDTLRDLKDVVVKGTITYDVNRDRAFVDYSVSGTMTLPCSISNDDVNYDFNGHTEEVYTFFKSDDPDEEVIEVTDVIDLTKSVFQTILFEIPLRIVKEGLTQYPKGEGWEVLSEAEYQNQEKPIDPRLAKLLEFKVEE